MQLFKKYNLEEKLAYINGYLTNLAILNSGTNCGCDYFFTSIKKKESIDKTIQNEFTPFFEWMIENRKIEYQKDLRVNYQEVTDLDNILGCELKRWLFEKEFPIHCKDIYQNQMLTDRLIQMLNNILEGNIQMWQVLDGSYDIEYFDLIIKDQQNYYYLHLGWCD